MFIMFKIKKLKKGGEVGNRSIVGLVCRNLVEYISYILRH